MDHDDELDHFLDEVEKIFIDKRIGEVSPCLDHIGRQDFPQMDLW